MSNINFANPWLLLLAIPFLVVVITPFLLAVKKENKNIHNVLSFVCHIIIVICATFAIAGTSYEATVTETEVYVLADVSHSANRNLDLVDGYVYEIEKSLPKNSKMALIAFGKDYKLLSDLGEKTVSVKTAEVDTSATDIAGALRYASNLFDDGVIKRIVVVTDGRETSGSDSITSVVSALEEDGVYVDAVFIDDNIPTDVNEVQISSVDYTAYSFLGKEEKAEITVNSNNSEQTRIYIDVECNGEKSSYAQVLYRGSNSVFVPLDTSQTGNFDYTVTVRTENTDKDTSLYNNSCLFTQKVTDEVKTLFIGGSRADLAFGQRIYGADATYILDPSEIPFTVEELCLYDEIALSNFDVRTFMNANGFLSALETAVSKFGKTLTTYGNTFVQEGYFTPDPLLSSLDGMLPVSVGNRDKDTRLITIVLDISTSTNFQGRLKVARAAAISILETFGEKDMVMIVGYSGDMKILRPTSYLRDKQTVIAALQKYEPRNGTVLYSAMEYAYKEISSRSFQHKEMIIISDGLNSDNKADCITLAENISADKIVISALGIYPAGNANDDFLKNLVVNKNANGKGYYKSIQNEKDVDYTLQTVTEEMSEVKIEGDSYKAEIKRPQEKVLDGVSSLSAVNGFWYNSLKSSAVSVVTAKYYRDKLTSFDVPLYAYWSYGNGKVTSFTSDLNPESGWTVNWNGEDENAFLKNIEKVNLPKEKISSPFIISAETAGDKTTVTVTAAAYKTGAELIMKLTYPDGSTEEKSMYYDSENYVCEFVTETVGRYKLNLTCDYAGSVYEAEKNFAVSYNAEYDSFAAYSASSLYRIISDNGEISLDGSLKMDNSDSDSLVYTFSFTVPLMAVCVILFVIDIIVRMLRIQDIKSLFLRKNKKAEKGGSE